MMTLPKTTQQGVGEGRLELRSVWLHSPCCLHNNEGWLMLGVHGRHGLWSWTGGDPRGVLSKGSSSRWYRAGGEMPSGARRGRDQMGRAGCKSEVQRWVRALRGALGPAVPPRMRLPAALCSPGQGPGAGGCRSEPRAPSEVAVALRRVRETVLPGPLNFSLFQSSKVPLKVEITRERRCLLPQRRKITLSRGFCNYIHLK